MMLCGVASCLQLLGDHLGWSVSKESASKFVSICRDRMSSGRGESRLVT